MASTMTQAFRSVSSSRVAQRPVRARRSAPVVCSSAKTLVTEPAAAIGGWVKKSESGAKQTMTPAEKEAWFHNHIAETKALEPVKKN